MRVAPHPLHRSGRAALPHPAPTLGHDAEPNQGIRMTHADRRQPPSEQPDHARPRNAGPLAASLQDPAPESPQSHPECADRPAIQRDAIVAQQM